MDRINKKLIQITQENRVGLMTHVVVGYPTVSETETLIEEMITSGTDIIELQIPFSDPIADGPTILKASDIALKNGTRITDAFAVVADIRKKDVDTPLLIMCYANTIIHYGIHEFVRESKDIGIDGFIIPDLPPDEPEGQEFLSECHKFELAPILILSPTSTDERLTYLTDIGKGFFYCVARTGVTGAKTDFSEDLEHFLEKCRKHTELPLAVGFGISKPEHIRFLRGKADIAVVGSETLRILEKDGIPAVRKYIESLIESGKS